MAFILSSCEEFWPYWMPLQGVAEALVKFPGVLLSVTLGTSVVFCATDGVEVVLTSPSGSLLMRSWTACDGTDVLAIAATAFVPLPVFSTSSSLTLRSSSFLLSSFTLLLNCWLSSSSSTLSGPNRGHERLQLPQASLAADVQHHPRDPNCPSSIMQCEPSSRSS